MTKTRKSKPKTEKPVVEQPIPDVDETPAVEVTLTEALAVEVDWDAVYEWAFGYNKANTEKSRMRSRFLNRHKKLIKGTREQMEQAVLELYESR